MRTSPNRAGVANSSGCALVVDRALGLPADFAAAGITPPRCRFPVNAALSTLLLARHMVALARERVPPNVDVRVADVFTMHLSPAHYDAVTSISVLHHLELMQVLPRLARTLRPGGVLIALALPKIDLPRDIPVEALSVVGHRLMGAAFRLEQALTGRRRYAYESSVHVMPMQDAVLTTRQVRAQATRVLPGVHVRRLPFWRYELRWRRPR